MAYDLTARGASLGPLSIRRCAHALAMYNRCDADRKPLIALGAGFAARLGFPEQRESIACMMAAYFTAHRVPLDDLCVPPFNQGHNPWGSGAEIMAALSAVFDKEAFQVSSHKDRYVHGRVTIVTSAYHVARCRRLARMTLERLVAWRENGINCIEVTTSGVYHPVPLREHAYELYKRAATFALAWWGILPFTGEYGPHKLGLV